MGLERDYKPGLKKRIKKAIPGSLIFNIDANDMQGAPDMLVLYENMWAVIEVKLSETARRQPNQEYYVELLDNMSFAAFIYPENEEEVIYALQQAFGIERPSRFSRR